MRLLTALTSPREQDLLLAAVAATSHACAEREIAPSPSSSTSVTAHDIPISAMGSMCSGDAMPSFSDSMLHRLLRKTAPRCCGETVSKSKPSYIFAWQRQG